MMLLFVGFDEVVLGRVDTLGMVGEEFPAMVGDSREDETVEVFFEVERDEAKVIWRRVGLDLWLQYFMF